MAKAKTVSIVGVTGFRNRGVEALVRPIACSLLAANQHTCINVFTWTPEFDRRRIQDSRVRFHRVGNFHPTFTRLERAARLVGIPSRGSICGWEELFASDLVVFSGGDCLSSEYGDTSFQNHLTPLRLAGAAGIPFVLYAQSIGPFRTADQRRWWDDVSRQAAHISVRESKTYEYLADELAFPLERLSLTADPAFVLEPSEAGIMLGNRLRPPDHPLIGVALSQGIAAWSEVDSATRLATWEQILRRFEKDFKAAIVLVPHVQEPHADDTIICHELWKRLGYGSHITVLAGDFTACDYKGVLSRCDMAIAERMHAGIAALSSGVPTALVAYSVKARGVLENLLGAAHSRGKALIEGDDLRSPSDVYRQLVTVWEARLAISATLAKTVESARGKAREGLTRLQTFMS